MASSEEENIRERIRLHAASLKEAGLLTKADLEGAGLLPVKGNANPFVPWDDPQIPYHCSCGQIIYSDTLHSHGEEQVYIESEHHRNEEAQVQSRTELTIDEVLEFWRAHTLAGYDVTDYDRDDNAHWRDRALTVEDAILYLRAQKAGTVHSTEWHNFGPTPPLAAEADAELAQNVKAFIHNYEDQLGDREVEAAEVYARSGDMV